MARPFDVCIRGAGIVGRTLALQLASQRLRVALVAQSPDSTAAHSDVRAYALSPASRALLESVRCWPDEAHATPVLSMQVQTADQGQTGASVQFDATAQHAPALNWIVDVPVLEQLLADAVRFQPLIEVHTEVHKEAQTAALTVVCEGRTSSTREEFGVEFDVTPYHQSAVAARVQCTLPHGQAARQWFADGEILAFLPMGGPQGSGYALVWSVTPERAKSLLELTPEAFCEALESASGMAQGTLTLHSDRKTWSLQAALAQRWCGSSVQASTQASWVLAGDAAHNVHPLAGQGLNLGLGDAAELARVLEARPYWRTVADPKLLRAYERARKAEYAMVGGSGDVLQQLFSQNNAAVQHVRDWGMRAFERSGALKNWIARRAMGAAPV
jgi:2-polyprenyl-6-methoxyphenol hydroxylase-like FAD-dependent oxidoreductase